MRGRYSLIFGLLLVAIVAGIYALTSGLNRQPDSPSVLLVTFDTTRADRIGCYGHSRPTSPTIDALAAARNGVLFRDAEACAPLTLPSHASLLTGLHPAEHGIRDNGAGTLPTEVSTLAERLKRNGYATAAFVSAEPLESRYGLDQGFDTYDDGLTRRTSPGGPLVERSARETTERALSWLRDCDAAPFFVWVHYFDPHLPHEAPEPALKAVGGDSYDAEIREADSQLARLLAELEELGTRSNTAVIVAGDHGEGLGDHGEDAHSLLVYRSTMHVPLVMQLPDSLGNHMGEAGCDWPVSLLDVAPTIVALAGIDPAGMPGHDLRTIASGAGPAQKQLGESLHGWRNYRWSPMYSLRDGPWRLITGSRDELFNLREDPGELVDRASEEPARLATMKLSLQAELSAIKQRAHRPTGSGAGVSIHGPYTSTGGSPVVAPTSDTSSSKLLDPRDGLKLDARISATKNALGSKSWAEARKLGLYLIKDDPGNPYAYILTGTACKEQNDDAAALKCFQAAADIDPTNAEVHATMIEIRIHQLRSMPEPAMRKALRGLEQDADALLIEYPTSGSLHFNRARLQILAGRPAEARMLLERAVETLHYEHARKLLVQVLIQLGERSEAERILRGGRRDDPALVDIRRQLALPE